MAEKGCLSACCLWLRKHCPVIPWEDGDDEEESPKRPLTPKSKQEPEQQQQQQQQQPVSLQEQQRSPSFDQSRYSLSSTCSDLSVTSEDPQNTSHPRATKSSSLTSCTRNLSTRARSLSVVSGASILRSKMAFFQNRSLSLVDMYIDTSEPTENVGQIQFSMEYNFNEMTLILRIMQAKELPAKDLSGTSDPYVRVTLLPDKKHKLETKIKRRTLHPKWHETFYFEGFPIQKLQSRVLHLHVFDYDRFSRDDSIGEVHIPLCQVDFSEKNNTFWKALHPLEKNKCGEILTSLMYQPSTSQLTLTVIKCRNLKAKDINGKSDPYVKVWLYFGEKRIEKKKSEVQFCTLNPEFNFSVMFEVPWERIRECQLNVTIMDHDKVGRNEAIGKIMLGKAGSGTSETKHWSDMITKPRQTVVMWHRLKPE
ncbi:synaptotagmin-7-like isoform X2 [Scylla paramamosain]|uniref:synaptotagmin-7-like isoform X2 n=1 Tax=Scylla paramamosain TaxID=85552 RepID=UPI00308289DE